MHTDYQIIENTDIEQKTIYWFDHIFRYFTIINVLECRCVAYIVIGTTQSIVIIIYFNSMYSNTIKSPVQNVNLNITIIMISFYNIVLILNKGKVQWSIIIIYYYTFMNIITVQNIVVQLQLSKVVSRNLTFFIFSNKKKHFITE